MKKAIINNGKAMEKFGKSRYIILK